MKAKIVKETGNKVWIEWSGDTGFGVLEIEYNGKGGYNVNAEYIGIKTFIEIMNAVDYDGDGRMTIPTDTNSPEYHEALKKLLPNNTIEDKE